MTEGSRADPLAVGALVVALLAFVFDCCCTYIGPPLSVLALVLGVVAAVKARKATSGSDLGIAIAAIAASVVNLLLAVALAVVVFAGVATDGELFPVWPDGPPPAAEPLEPGTGGPLLPTNDPLPTEPPESDSGQAPGDGDGGSPDAAPDV